MTARTFPYTPYPGSPGACCDALPTGEFVALIPGERCETHLGPIDFLDANNQPLYPRINPVGPFTFAGQASNNGDRAIEWDGQWRVRLEVVCGVNGAIYDNDGQLRINFGCLWGSQGARYVTIDNIVITGDATYPPAPGVPLCEWTQLLPDLYVGQGTGDGGLYVVDRGVKRELIPESAGLCRFINARIKGDLVSIAWWGQGTLTAELRWTTVDELRSLPVYVPPQPPTPIPPPTPPPVPPEPTPMTPNHFDTVTAVFAEGGFDLTTHDGCGLFTEACARALHARDDRWGHLLKRPGQNQFRGHAVDAVLYRHDGDGNGVAVDLIRANTTPDAAPAWGEDIPRYSSSDWLEPEPCPVSRIVRPSMPFLVAATCFDLGVSRDFALVDELKAAGINTLRIVVASRHRTDRTLEAGRLQLRSLLPKLIERGMKASIVVNCDTALYEMNEHDIRSHTSFVNAILRDYPAAVALVELFNENSHGVEVASLATDPHFLRELDALIDAQFPVAWGANHGGEAVSDRLAGGSVICYHSDRALSPAENARIMASAQARFGKRVVNMEPKGIDEVPRGDARTDLPTFIEMQAQADKAELLGGSCAHFEAGLTASSATPPFGPKQRTALRLFGAVFTGTTPSPVPPTPVPPVPPPSGDPILDTPLFPAYPEGYTFFVKNYRRIEDEAQAWYYRAFKRHPADDDIAHGLYRAIKEGDRWKTLRGAFEEAWPGGGR